MGKTHIIPEAVIDEVQGDLIPKNVTEVKAFVGIWRYGQTFIPYLVQYLHSLYCPIKRDIYWTEELDQRLPL